MRSMAVSTRRVVTAALFSLAIIATVASWSIQSACGASDDRPVSATHDHGMATSSGIDPNPADVAKPPKKGIVKTAAYTLKRLHEKVSEKIITVRTQRLFETASKAFPAFCGDWGRKLRDRERDNVGSIQWQDRQGGKVGHYTGYGKIMRCETKQSSHGIPIGELTYSEYEYSVAGKSVEEARHAKPKADGTTNTTEIFRWDRNHWDY